MGWNHDNLWMFYNASFLFSFLYQLWLFKIFQRCFLLRIYKVHSVQCVLRCGGTSPHHAESMAFKSRFKNGLLNVKKAAEGYLCLWFSLTVEATGSVQSEKDKSFLKVIGNMHHGRTGHKMAEREVLHIYIASRLTIIHHSTYHKNGNFFFLMT